MRVLDCVKPRSSCGRLCPSRYVSSKWATVVTFLQEPCSFASGPWAETVGWGLHSWAPSPSWWWWRASCSYTPLCFLNDCSMWWLICYRRDLLTQEFTSVYLQLCKNLLYGIKSLHLALWFTWNLFKLKVWGKDPLVTFFFWHNVLFKPYKQPAVSRDHPKAPFYSKITL